MKAIGRQLLAMLTQLKSPRSAVWLFLAIMFVFRPVAAQNFTIKQYTVAGGGGTSTNGTLTVRGTTGQPDASGSLKGGNLSVAGGFWSVFKGIPIPPVPVNPLVWTNTAGGVWSVAANWSPNQVPTGTNDVLITNSGTYTVTLNLHNQAARSITIEGASGVQTFTMLGSSLVVSNALTIGAAGVFQGQGTLTCGDIVVNGEFQVAPFGVFLVGGGPFDVAGGKLKVPFDLRLANRIVRNSGTVTISDGHHLFLGDNTWFTNFPSGTLLLTNDNSSVQYNGNFPNTNQFFANDGIVRSHGNTFIEVPSAHSGVIEVVTGEFSLRRHPSFSGFGIDVTAICNVSTGATLAFLNAQTEFRAAASVHGAGSLRVSGGDFNLAGTYNLVGTLVCHNNAVVHLNTGAPFSLPNLLNDFADVRGSDPLNITGSLLWRNGGKFNGPAPVVLAASCQTTLEVSGLQMNRPFMANAGTMNWISAEPTLGTNSFFTNLASGTITITNNEALMGTFIRFPSAEAPPGFHNAGLMRVTSDTPTECGIAFVNTGTLRIERNEFRMAFGATFTQNAGVTELAGGHLRFFPGSNFRLFGGALTGSGDVIGDDVENFGGTISPGASPGQINFNQSLDLNPAGAMNIELAGTNAVTAFDQVTVAGTATLTGGILNVAVADGFEPPLGTKFLIVSAARRSGQFSTLNYPSNQIGLQLNYLTNGVELEVVTPGEQVFLVRNLNDSGAGSLRQAAQNANVSAAPQRRIHFAITNSPPHTITLASPVVITDRIVVDGRTQPGFAGAPIVTIRAVSDVYGIKFWGSNSFVRGLAFTDFTRPAIQFGESGFSFGNANAVEGCYFGVDATGTNVTLIALSDPQNRAHIVSHGNFNRIGGTNAAARNLFTGHNGSGVLLHGQSNVVQGNFFGTDVTGTNRLGQLNAGVVQDALGARVGGPEPGAGNVFGFLNSDAVVVHLLKDGCEIRGNSMFANSGRGISIGASVNDAGDTDGDLDAGNEGQNFPIIASVQNQVGGSVISGALNSRSNATFTLDFYANTECDSSGNGEGKRYLGFTQVTTDVSGNASFNFTPTIGNPILSADEIVTATATDAAGNTSEFSPCSGIVSLINGQVAHSGTPLPGATVRLSGTRTGTTNTDASGNFAFPGLPTFGAYSVLPSKPGFVFSPSSHSFSNLNAPGIANFDFAVGTFTIRGAVRDASGNAIVGAQVALSGGAAAVMATDQFGSYAFRGLPGLSNYTIAVTKAAFSFGPPSNIVNLVANRIVNFIGLPPPHNIVGRVRTAGGQGVPGVTVQVFRFSLLTPGALVQSAQTDSQGVYQLINLPANQRYWIRLSSPQFVFQPDSATLQLENTDLTADFTANTGHRIRGQITGAGSGAVSVRFTETVTDQLRGSVATDANRGFTSPLLADGGTYEVRPVSPFDAFTPATRLVSNLAGDVTGQDFSAQRQNFALHGRVVNAAGLAVPDVSLVLIGGGANETKTVFGTFSFIKPAGNAYTITPSRAGFVFSPSNVVINPLTNNQEIAFLAAPLLPLTGRIGFVDVVPRIMNADSTGVGAQTSSSQCPPGFGPDAQGICVPLDPLFQEDVDADDFDINVPQNSSRVFLSVALSPNSRSLAFIEETTVITHPFFQDPMTNVTTRLWLQEATLLSAPVLLGVAPVGRISWSANSERLAVKRVPGLWVINTAGDGDPVPSTGIDDRDPALSPDGTRLAFARKVNGQYDIFIVNVNGTGLMQVTASAGDDVEPAWSSDGQSIAFASNRGGDFEIFRMDTQQFQDIALTSNAVDDREPTWSPDGSMIGFTRNGVIHAMNASNGSLQTALHVGSSPSWATEPIYVTPESGTFGQNVTVDAGSIDVTFNGVISAGETIIKTISPISDPALRPEGYFVVNGLAFDITTTANFLSPITICVHLPEIDQPSDFNNVSILHTENGQQVDVTVSRNFATRRICGGVNSLSPFSVAMRIDPALPLINGAVVDSTGAGVPDVLIALNGESQLQATTDPEGKFTFGNLATGSNYTVTALDSRYSFVPSSAFVESVAGTNTLVFTAVPVASPTLRIAPDLQNPGAFTLTWPIDSWPFVLESTDSLATPNWVQVSAPRFNVGNDFVIEVKPGEAMRYFRLRRD